MFQSLTLKAPFSPFAASLFLLLFLFPWLALCSKQPCTSEWYKSLQLTKESLDKLTAHLTGGSTSSQSVRPPADLAAEKANWKLWMKYIIGSAAVFGAVDRCALDVIHGFWKEVGRDMAYLPGLLGELVENNDRGTVARFIAKNGKTTFWTTSTLGNVITELMRKDWDTMHPLFEEVLAILKKDGDKSKECKAILGCMPVELQYQRINTGQVPLDEIDKVYLFDEPIYSLLREIFFQARCSPTPNPEIREYIATTVPWFRQFMPEDIPSNAKDTCVTSIVEPDHDVWVHIGSFMDAETLIFVWPLVCKTWNRSYFKILTKGVKVHEWLLQDLAEISWNRIHTIAPWNHFLDETSSAAYLGQCIMGGALGRVELDDLSHQEIQSYLHRVIWGMIPIPEADEGSTRYNSFKRLLEEGHKAYGCRMPVLIKPPLLTDEEYEKVLYHLVCEKQLVFGIGLQWIFDNIPRVYSVLGEDQALIERVIDLGADSSREPLFIWIMIGQACGMTEETARLVFDKPGIFTEKFLRPVFVKPSEYYDFIAESGMLFEMVKFYYKHTKYDHGIGMRSCETYELNYFMISLFLFFKGRPAKTEQIAAAMTKQLPTLGPDVLKRAKDLFGTKTMGILTYGCKYPQRDVEFVQEMLTQCGLLEKPPM